MPRLTTERLVLFGTLPATFGELHPLCDHRVNAAKPVSTYLRVSLPMGSRRSPSVRGSGGVSRLAGVNAGSGNALLRVADPP